MNIFKRVVLLCVGIIFLVTHIIFSGLLNSPGIDYTNEYEVYKDITSLTSVQDVETYLCSKNIQYMIEESKLVLTDYDDIEYIINPDNCSGYIKNSNIHHNLARLDERDLDIVTVKRNFVNNETIETIYLEDSGLTYTKIDNKYYIEPTLIYLITFVISLFGYIILLPSAIVILTIDFFDWIKKRKKAKKDAVTKTEETSENENNKS